MSEISVIVPVYNVEDKLDRCLNSIRNQTFKDFEVLLVDDGSKDGSGSICDSFARLDERFKVFHLENGGVSKARNYGIEKASSRYICFIDSDDFVQDQYLEVMKIAMTDKCDLCICGVNYCLPQGEIIYSQERINDFCFSFCREEIENISKVLDDRRLNYVYGKLYRKDIIVNNNIQFYENINLGEDTIFVMDYIKCVNKVQIIGASYYNYVKYTDGTLTTKKHEYIYSKYLFVNNYIEDTFNNLGLLDTTIKDAIYKRFIISAKWALDSLFDNKEKTKKETITLMDNVLKSDELKRALFNYHGFDDVYPDVQLMRKQSGKILYQYYCRLEKKERWEYRFKFLKKKILGRG